MAATRLSDAQKQELVSRFQNGDSTQELADAYGCSPNTVIRVAKAALGASGYEEIKRQRGRRSAAPVTQAAEAPAAPADPPPAPVRPAAQEEQPSGSTAQPDTSHATAGAGTDGESHEAARSLAIDDADDFDEVDAEDDGDADDIDADLASVDDPFVEVAVSLVDVLDQPLTTPRPWPGEDLPASAYMLVDKTVELQARPIAEITELGRVSEEELDLQALVLYSNPRQAKRQCGRTQRVIKVPDMGVFARTAPYLLRQGIRRVVLEGALYALPGA